MEQTTAVLRALVDNVERVITGKRHVVELAVVALAAGGHVLLEDVPGVGKTVLARSLARSIDGSFARVQGAPDLLPADITGSSIYEQRASASPAEAGSGFRFVPGPIFANVVLVDELNRTTPRSQAALLEAMEEHQVSVDGVTHPLPEVHLVIATQNPLEHVGTFPLPESQLDRFTVATSVGYPTASQERDVIRAQVHQHPLGRLQPVVSLEQVLNARAAVRDVTVSDEVVDYVVRLVDGTRNHEGVELGASPRSSIQLVHAAQAWAAMQSRGFVLPDDVKLLAPHVLPHRLLTRRTGAGEVVDATRVVTDLLRSVPVGAGVQ